MKLSFCSWVEKIKVLVVGLVWSFVMVPWSLRDCSDLLVFFKFFAQWNNKSTFKVNKIYNFLLKIILSFQKILNNKNILPLRLKKLKLLNNGFFGFFASYNKIIISQCFFFVILRLVEGILVFLSWKNIFYSKKLLACAHYAPAREWHSRTLSGTCDVIQCPNLHVYHVSKSIIISSSRWCCTWQQMIRSLSLMVFFSSFFFLEKVHVCSLFFWFFNFSPYIFYCLISSLAIL